jgi:hypothetical protein
MQLRVQVMRKQVLRKQVLRRWAGLRCCGGLGKQQLGAAKMTCTYLSYPPPPPHYMASPHLAASLYLGFGAMKEMREMLSIGHCRPRRLTMRSQFLSQPAPPY